jgi:hypothetical protein
MEKQPEILTVKMQMILNKRLCEMKQIPRNVYTEANELLFSRLTKCKECSIISHTEMF